MSLYRLALCLRRSAIKVLRILPLVHLSLPAISRIRFMAFSFTTARLSLTILCCASLSGQSILIQFKYTYDSAIAQWKIGFYDSQSQDISGYKSSATIRRYPKKRGQAVLAQEGIGSLSRQCLKVKQKIILYSISYVCSTPSESSGRWVPCGLSLPPPLPPIMRQ